VGLFLCGNRADPACSVRLTSIVRKGSSELLVGTASVGSLAVSAWIRTRTTQVFIWMFPIPVTETTGSRRVYTGEGSLRKRPGDTGDNRYHLLTTAACKVGWNADASAFVAHRCCVVCKGPVIIGDMNDVAHFSRFFLPAIMKAVSF